MPPGTPPPSNRPKTDFPAPFDIGWNYRRRAPTDATLIKAMRAALLWRGATPAMAAAILLRYSGWLLRFPGDLVRFLVREGPQARRRYGRSLVGQASDMLLVARLNGVRPRDYYFADLARLQGSPELSNYIPSRLFAEIAATLTRSKDPGAMLIAKDKLVFEERCRAAGLPAIESLHVVTEEGVRSHAALPPCDLILKPVSEYRGYGIEGWDYCGGSYRLRGSQEIRSPSQLLERATELAGRYSRILIQKRIRNHPAIAPFSGSALATTRFVTVLDEDGRPEIVDAFFRTSGVPGAVVDNYHSGGLIFPIDLTSGAFRPGFANTDWSLGKLTHHPETGTMLAGTVHPAWSEMSVLARRLHATFPSFVIVGWDIAYGEDGLIITEANSSPEISINRQGTMNGLAGTRMLGLVAYHVARWLMENEPPGSRWRPETLPEALRTIGNRPLTLPAPRAR